jgi:hypothetical protein
MEPNVVEENGDNTNAAFINNQRSTTNHHPADVVVNELNAGYGINTIPLRAIALPDGRTMDAKNTLQSFATTESPMLVKTKNVGNDPPSAEQIHQPNIVDNIGQDPTANAEIAFLAHAAPIHSLVTVRVRVVSGMLCTDSSATTGTSGFLVETCILSSSANSLSSASRSCCCVSWCQSDSFFSACCASDNSRWSRCSIVLAAGSYSSMDTQLLLLL